MTRSVDVLLVTPPSKDLVFQALGKELTAIEMPVWASIVAKFLQNKGYSVGMLDGEAEALSYAGTASKIVDAGALLTVFVVYGHQPSASTQCMPAGRAVCKLVSEQAPNLNTIVMGTHASALPESTLLDEPYKFVCQGEGPFTILGLLEALKSKSDNFYKIPGLWFLEDGVVRSNPIAPNIEDLDSHLPGQAWDLLDFKKYRAHNWHCFEHIDKRQPYASLQTSLGCPYKCSFCCINAPFSGPGIRFWSPEMVLSQIDILVNDYGVKNIKIPDEMFILNESHVVKLCDLIIERGYDLNIWAYARVDSVKDKYLEKLKKAGFSWLALGIESGSKFVRDGVEKGRFGDLDILKNTNKIKEHGINLVANFIFGLPDDTRETMQSTFDLALEINAEWVNFYCAMAYPGSPLYDWAKKMNLPLPESAGGPGWIGYSQHAYETCPLPTDNLSAIEVLDFRDEAFNKYFTDSSYLHMIQNKFGPKVVEHIDKMVECKIKRKHHDVVSSH